MAQELKHLNFDKETQGIPRYSDVKHEDKYNGLMEYDYEIANQKPQKPYTDEELLKGSVNKNVLDNIPVIPEMAQDDYQEYAKMPEWFEKLQVATPDEIDEWRNKGKMGVAETWQRKRKWEMIPFSGTTAETTLLVRNANTLRKLKNGEQVSQVEMELLSDYLRDIKELEVRGGHTIAGSGMDIMLNAIPYLGEFGAALALIPEGVGFGAIGKQLADIGAKKAAEKTLKAAMNKAATETLMTGATKTITDVAAKEIYENAQKAALKNAFKTVTTNMTAKEIAGTVAKSTPKMLWTSFKAGAIVTPQNFVRSVTDHQLSTGVYVTDAGDATFLNSENIATSIFKAIGETTFEALTETAGSSFAPIFKYFAKPIRRKLPQAFFKNFDELVSKRYNMPTAQALKKFGYDGVIEEMGEEVLNRFLCQTFGINGLDQYTLDGFLNNVFYADRPEQWLSEALAFAGMGGIGHAAARGGLETAKRMKNAYEKQQAGKLAKYAQSPEFMLENVRDVTPSYSTEEFYLDQGLIRIKGSQSLAEQLLREKLEQNNVDKATADEYLEKASETEIRDLLKVYQIEQQDVMSLNKARQLVDVNNKLFNSAISAGQSQVEAKHNADIMTHAIASMVNTDNISVEKVFDMMKMNIQNMTVEDAQKMLNGKKSVPAEPVEASQKTSASVGYQFENVINALKNNKLSDIDNEIEYTPFLAAKIDEVNTIYNDYQAEVKQIKDEYNEKTLKAKTKKAKLAIADERQAELTKIEKKYSKSKNKILKEIKAEQANIEEVPEFVSQPQDPQQEIKIPENKSDYDKLFELAQKQIEQGYFSREEFDELFAGEHTEFIYRIVEDYETTNNNLGELSLNSSKEHEELLKKAKSQKKIDEINKAYQERIDDIDKSYLANYSMALQKLDAAREQLEFDEDGDLILRDNYGNRIDRNGNFVMKDGDIPEIAFQAAMLAGINPEQKVDVVDLSSNFANDSQLTKKDLSQYIQSLIGSKPLTTKDKKALFSFVKRSQRVGKKDVYLPDHIANSSKVEINNIGERNTAVNNITDLIQNSFLIEITENNDKTVKPHIDNYLRFYVPIKINNDIFTVRIVAENNTNKNLFNVLNADIYDVIIDKKMPTSVLIPANTQRNLMKSTSDNIITDNSEIFNPQQITIREMLKDVEDADGNIYFQSANIAGAESNEIEAAAREWQEKGTDSSYFKKWSDNAPVVSSEDALNYDFKTGEKVAVEVYHGTRDIFDIFDKKGKSSDTARVGFWFTDRENFAENFARNIWWGEQDNPIVMHCFISMKNPKVYEERIVSGEEKEAANNRVVEIKNKIRELNQQFNKIIQETGSYAKATEAVEEDRKLLKAELKEAESIYAELRYTDPYEQLRTDIRKIEGGNAEDANFGGLGMVLKNQDTVEKFVENLKEQGYDGIIIKGTTFDSEDAETNKNNQYAVFYPEQIKSVDNRGTFDESNPNIYFQPAYNGSPYYFDKFSTEHIGSGEGNQAHGWGLYFAKNRNVSEGYRRRLTDLDNWENRKVFDKKNKKELSKNYDFDIYYALNRIAEINKDLNAGKKEYINFLEKQKERYKNDTFEQEFIEKELKIVEEINVDDYEVTGVNQGQLYKVDIPEDKELLDEDEPLSMQKSNVSKEAVSGILINEIGLNDKNIKYLEDLTNEALENEIKIASDNMHKLSTTNNSAFHIESAKYDLLNALRYDDLVGRDVYQALVEYQIGLGKSNNPHKEASLLLNDYGIKGIKYNGRQDGECYVIFDDKSIDILETYYQFIGEEGASNINEAAKSFEAAKQLDAKGEHNNRIYQQTGWFKGADGKWRYEISDADAKIIAELQYYEAISSDDLNKKVDDYNEQLSDLIKQKDSGKLSQEDFRVQYDEVMSNKLQLVDKYYSRTNFENEAKNTFKLSDVLQHDKLYAAYPELKNATVKLIDTDKYGGMFDEGKVGNFSMFPTIYIAKNTLEYGDVKSVLMHEIQHYIQSQENFARGGSPEYVMQLVKLALNKVKATETEKKRVQMLDEIDHAYSELEPMRAAQQVMKVYRDERNLYKTYWWSKYGTWGYAPKNTKTKKYRAFMDKWIPKYLNGTMQIMKDRGHEQEYNEYLQMDIEELNRLCKNKSAKIDRLYAKLPKDISYSLRQAVQSYDKAEEYEKSALLKELYRKLAGETEARNTQTRMNMTEEERLAKPPQFTQEYEDHQQLIVFGDGSTIPFKSMYKQEPLTPQERIKQGLDAARGFSTQRKSFDGTVKENLIVLLQNKADKSTLLHEFAHVYLMTLQQLAKVDAKASMHLNTINRYLRYNGVEYTEAQHEKFARGFEAYLKAGKAPTYKLQKAFEHFKLWLNEIYDRVLYGDMQKDLVLDDETKAVFDELLGGDTGSLAAQRAEKVVEQARTNANLQIKEKYSNGQTFNNHRLLSDTQKRYRDVAVDILSAASGVSAKYIMTLTGTQDAAKQKKLYDVLQKCDGTDRISSGDGFKPEWAEFFYDTGVSYESGEVGADWELASQAYDVLSEQRYLYEENYVDEYPEEMFEQIEYEYEYFVDRYREAKDQEKDTVLLAFYQWIDNVPKFIQDDYFNKWMNASAEIDRYESLDKFEKAKTQIKLYAQHMQHSGDFSTQFAEYTRQIFITLDFLTEKDKEKMWDKIKQYDSFKALYKNIDDIMDYAQTLDEVSERRRMADEIDYEVKRTIHEWKNGIKKTKYTYPANKLFERLRQIQKLTLEEVQAMYDAQVNDEVSLSYEADAIHDEDYYKSIEQMYVTFRANGSYYNSNEFLKNLLEKIQNAKFTAKVARDEIDFERRMQKTALQDELAKALNKHKDKVSKIETMYSNAFNFNSALQMIFDEKAKNTFSLDYLYAQKDAQVGADRDAVLEQLARVFGFTGKTARTQLFNKFIDMTKPEFSIRQRYTPDKTLGEYRETQQDPETGFNVTVKTHKLRKDGDLSYKEWEDEEVQLSRMQVIYYYIQSMNKTSYQILTDMGDETHPPKGQFDKSDFDNLMMALTPQEQMMAVILQQAAAKYYDKLNKYHINKYHTELGKVDNYFPRKTDVSMERVYEPFSDYSNQLSNQKFQKQRTAWAGTRIKPANALEVLFTHIEQANTLIIMGEKLDLINRVFSDADLKRKIANIWGDRVQQDFYNQIAGNLYSGQQSLISNAERDCASIMNNVIKSQIFAKPQVGLKQLISFMNYGVGDDYVSSKEWFVEFSKQIFSPQKWKSNVEFMMNIPYLKDRFSRGGSSDAMKQQLETRFFAKVNLLDEYLSLPIRYGDVGAIILGGKPYINVLKNKGFSENEAIRIFIEKTVNDQQSSIPSTLSNLQRNSNKNPLSKMFFAYQNTPWQYFRTAYNSIIKFKQNPNLQTGTNMAKLIGLYMYVFPLMFNMASSLSLITLFGQGDDDDVWKDVWRSCIGGFTFIPIVGSFINSAWTGLHGDTMHTGDWFATAASKVNKVARDIKKGEITPTDIFIAIALFGEATTGLPLTTLGGEASGVYDIATGKVAKGALKVGGYTDYRAKKVTGEEE